ncbi:MAG TPA: hypothetical protein VN903_35580 [Polyangia bacterium]|nr:hypothetical protein [Polyangia bacterium]
MPQKSEMVVNSLEAGFRWRQNQESKLWARTLYFSSFSAAAGSATLDDATFPGGTLIEGAFIYIYAVFAGGAVSATTFSMGTTGSATAYVNAQDVFTAAGIFKPGVTIVPGTPMNATSPLAAGTVRFTVTTTTANTNALTTGRVDCYIRTRSVAAGLN